MFVLVCVLFLTKPHASAICGLLIFESSYTANETASYACYLVLLSSIYCVLRYDYWIFLPIKLILIAYILDFLYVTDFIWRTPVQLEFK